MSPLALAALSGLLLGASFPPSPFGVLSFVAYVPLLLMISSRSSELGRLKLVGLLYVTFFTYHAGMNWWISSWQEHTDPYLFASGIVLSLAHPFFLMLPFLALISITRRLGSGVMIAISPLALAGFEWLHGQTDASYPWLTTGYALVHSPFAQIADTVGVYGLSFFIGCVNAGIAYWLINRTSLARPWLIPTTTALGLVAWLALGISHKHTSTSAHQHTSTSAHQHTSTLTVALVQPNVDPWDKWSDTRTQVRVHKALVDSMRASGVQPDLVIWSETAIPFMIREPEFEPDAVDLRTWVDTSRITLLTGFADRMVYSAGQAPASARTSRFDPSVRFDVFNSAMVVGKNRGEDVVHHKSMLTPFAERLPFADQLTFAMSWIQWGVGISSWGKGQTRLPLPVSGARIGTIICIESIYPEVARDMVNNGADMLCVITNDAWYNGTWGPVQHFDIARMRAIEQRRTVLRCAMSGVTGVILPDGSTLEANEPGSSIAPLTQGIAVGRVTTSTERTVYASIGDVIPPVGLFLTILALITARIPAVVRKMRVRTEL